MLPFEVASVLLVVAMVGAIILVRPADETPGGTPLGRGQRDHHRHVLVVGGLLFAIGLFVALSRRNAVGVLMGVELMLNSVNLNLIGFAKLRSRRGRSTGRCSPCS